MLSFKRVKEVAKRHLYFVGPGLVSAVAYIDPGNWATDLQAGSQYGYKLLFIVLIAGLAAVVLQTLSVRLGATTSTSLPHQTRQLILRLKEKYPKYRVALHCLLWFLYIMAEAAIIATDLAELLGSAIALHMLFPRLPLFAGVLITATDVLVVLIFFNSNKGRQGMLFFEILIVTMVLAVFVSFMVLLDLIKPDWGDVFFGYVPSATLVKPGALYIGVGIIGATVMPHALFLGSSLSSVDRLNMLPVPPELHPKTKLSHKLPSLFKRQKRRTSDASSQNPPGAESSGSAYELEEVPADSVPGRLDRTPALIRGESEIEEVGKDVYGLNRKKTEYEKALERYQSEVKSFDRIKWVDIHLFHATIDTATSLLCFALTINSSILILAGASYYYNPNSPGEADLEGAHALLRNNIGNGAAIIFALALLCAGQSASITATLAGQVVSEGFINWRTNPTLRRLITRLISVTPAAIIAAAYGSQGLNTMLVASQVLLSIVLPTVIFPLVYLCSRADIMVVEGPEVEAEEHQQVQPPTSTSDNVIRDAPALELEPAPLSSSGPDQAAGNSTGTGTSARRKKTYVSSKIITVLGYILFAVVLVANCYVIVELGLGNGG